MTARVAKLVSSRKNGPFCVAKVRVSAVDTTTRRFRVERTSVAGLPIDQCGHRASYRIDGEALCDSHAGRRAISILAEEPGQ